jgi:hypothetical protein
VAFGSEAYGSATGSAWTDLGAGPQMPLLQVRWLAGRFVAVGRYETLETSPDGLQWSQTGLSPVYGPPDTALNDVSWNGSTYVAVGFYPTESSGAFGYPIIKVSPDLSSWTSIAAPPGGGDREELDGIVWTGARFVAVGRNNSGGVVFVSDDGRSWTRISGPGGAGIVWNGRELVAVGGAVGPVVWRSEDGLTWQSTTVSVSYFLTAVTWDGSRFVAVGANPRVYPPQTVIVTSPDGVAWGDNETNVSESLVAVGSYFGTTVAAGLNGTVLTQACLGGEPSYVPAAAHLLGLNGSSWRTDLEVHNPGPAQVGYEVELLKRDTDNSAPVSQGFTLDPGKSVRHTDALASVFGFGGAGTLRVTPFGGTVMTSARTYDDAPAGSFGQFVEGQPATAAITTSRTARMIQLAQATDRSAGFRTNLGLVSASAGAMSVVVDLFRADGIALGELTVPLRPFESVQRNEVFREVTSDAVDDGYIVVRTTTDGSRFFAYATLIDNRSNDPVYIPAR